VVEAFREIPLTSILDKLEKMDLKTLAAKYLESPLLENVIDWIFKQLRIMIDKIQRAFQANTTTTTSTTTTAIPTRTTTITAIPTRTTTTTEQQKDYTGYGRCVDDEALMYDKRYKVDLGRFLTPYHCIKYCKNGYPTKFRYAGLRHKSCYCGDDDPSADKTRALEECDIKCQGDKKLSCGGINKMNVFDTSLPVPCHYGGCFDCGLDECNYFESCKSTAGTCSQNDRGTDGPENCFPSNFPTEACPPVHSVRVVNEVFYDKTTKDDYRACWEHCKYLDEQRNIGCHAWTFDGNIKNKTENCYTYNSIKKCQLNHPLSPPPKSPPHNTMPRSSSSSRMTQS